MSDPTDSWIELKDPAHQLQLFAACPVCFLSVATAIDPQCAPSNVDSLQQSPQQQRNVMVISWLMPFDQGRLVMSMNQRRHTSSMLEQGSHFCLSILTEEMEELALQVGSTSGRWGKSKFPQDHHPDTTSIDHINNSKNNHNQPMSKRAKKRQRFEMGVPGLYWTALGRNDDKTVTKDNTTVFAIDGTLARVHCQIVSREESVIDDEHYFVMVHIQQAFVKESHWNSETNVFGPRKGSSPSTLSFFGSQSFGAVRCLPLSSTTTTNINTSSIEATQKNSHKQVSWIRLEDAKQLSRLLYTNPLCWMIIHKNDGSSNNDQDKKNNPVALVEVSRLTATNNLGSFMFCVAKTSKDVKRLFGTIGSNEDGNETTFTLSVPVQGMEDLVQTVFEGNSTVIIPQTVQESAEPTETKQNSGIWDASKIPWETIQLGANEECECGDSNDELLRYAAGCAAHLHCRVYDSRPSGEGATDEDEEGHKAVVLFAKVEHAFVNPNYWEATKNRLVPSAGSEPYMKRLGDHTFGYVTTS